MLSRLDFYGTDKRWHKPRHGVCDLCDRAVIDHPTVKHRLLAAVCIAAGWLLGNLPDTTEV